MNTEHVHKDLIIAWANGAKIQFYDEEGNWHDCETPWWDPSLKFRVKPEEKKKVHRWLWCHISGIVASVMYSEEEMSKIDTDSHYKKLEWSKTEFEE